MIIALAFMVKPLDADHLPVAELVGQQRTGHLLEAVVEMGESNSGAGSHVSD